MIGSAWAWGVSGYSIVEEGELDPVTFSLNVDHYLVVAANGDVVPGHYSFEEAKAKIEALDAGQGADK